MKRVRGLYTETNQLLLIMWQPGGYGREEEGVKTTTRRRRRRRRWWPAACVSLAIHFWTLP